MREIKFRVWCKRTQTYHKIIDEEDYDPNGENIWLQMCIDTNGRFYFIETSNEDTDFEYVTHDCEIIDDQDKENFIVEQYTGLKDINNSEIYEGDILEDGSGEPSEYWIVKFEDGKFIGSTQGVDEDIFELTDLEIVGNIHENPELVNKNI